MAAFDQATSAASTPRQFKPYPNPPAAERVRAVIMADERGEMQVLAPESGLLDVAAVRQATGRALRAHPCTALGPAARIARRHADRAARRVPARV